ncbi:MAG: hypothetical protein K6C05_08940, partial [Anaerovibrio sp.]|uniref:hypothetical protein n=1 Tax=Anaerovibrio sp. TaxID=1872532 RepID=UPI0025DC8F00
MNDKEHILHAGERFLLRDESVGIEIVSGTVEVYGVTREEQTFRQCYLINLEPGDGAFPAFDDFNEIDIQLYALEDVVLREISLSGESVEKLRPLMQGWFKKMMSLSWLRLLA